MIAHQRAPREGLDFAIGVAFGLANIVVMGGLVRATVRTGGALPKPAAIWATVKFPVLYGALFATLHWGHVGAMAFLAGFTAMLIALLLTGLLPASRQPANSATASHAPAPAVPDTARSTTDTSSTS